jgi:pimeloyl-ACP methyl ester carboxylesterase
MLLFWLMRLLSGAAPRVAGRVAVLLTLRTRKRPGRRPPGALADRFLVPGSGEVVVHRLGANTGPRVLLVHGWNGSANDWHAVAQAMVAAGFSVTVLDLPAHGASPGRTSSLPRFVRGVREADRRHGPFDVWVAHSMGAAAVLAVLATGSRARRVILLSGVADPTGALRAFASGFGLSTAGTRAYLDGIERSEKMSLADLDGVRNAGLVTAPILVVHDRADRVVPIEEGRKLAQAMPSAQLLQTDGLGHRRILSDATIVQSVVAFAKG